MIAIFLYGGWQRTLLSNVNFEDPLAILVSEDSDASYEARFRDIRNMNKVLSTGSLKRLLSFLELQLSVLHIDEDELASLKNDVADKILAQRNVPVQLLDIFKRSLKDIEQGVVWHNYMIQKLDLLYTTLNEDHYQSQTYQLILSAIEDKRPGIPGTGLLALFRLSRNEDSVGQEVVVFYTKRILEGGDYGFQDKMTALQVADLLDLSIAHEYARYFLKNKKSPVMLQTVALGALGNSMLDVSYLNEYANRKDVRLRRSALIGLEERGH